MISNNTLVLQPYIDKPIIKSPMNYIGGKSKLLPFLIPLFPSNIEKVFDVFAGGCNVGINVNAKKHIFNDNLTYLIDLYKFLYINTAESIIDHIESTIEKFSLSITNQEGYNTFRDYYNTTRHPLDLFVLIAFSFNHQIRFNNKHQFNNPFGKNRSSFNAKMKSNMLNFISIIQELDCTFISQDFSIFIDYNFDINDFVYCDPPYLITTGTYNDGKRGFKGWSANEEIQLLRFLSNIDRKGMRFGLSNVLTHKGQANNILQSWLENNPQFKIHFLQKSYDNSNFQSKKVENAVTTEVYICNYD